MKDIMDKAEDMLTEEAEDGRNSTGFQVAGKSEMVSRVCNLILYDV